MSYLNLRGFTDYNALTFTDILAIGLCQFFNNAFLNAGAYSNVYIYGSGFYGGQPSTLRRVNDPRYLDGQVYEGFRSNWVYENLPNAISISGVYLNGNLTQTGYSINYSAGQVIFDNPIQANKKVDCEFSYKFVNFSTSDTPWFREFQFNSSRNDNFSFFQSGSGLWNILAKDRVQLPAIVIEPLNNVSQRGYEQGGGVFRYQDVICHIFAETPWDRNKLADTIINQFQKSIYLFDVNTVVASGFMQLDYQGFINPSGYSYPQLVSPPPFGYRYRKTTFLNISSQYYQAVPPMYMCAVRISTETEMPEI